MTNVGQVIPAQVLPRLTVGQVQSLVDADDFSRLATATRDPRLPATGWEHCLKYELMMFANWLARRALAGHQSGASETEDAAPPWVVTLLPRYGFALHALRRAIPFAALGLTTIMSVPDECQDDARTAISPLADALGLDRLLTLSTAPPATVVRHAADAGTPIFLTGRLKTWQHLTELHPDAHIVGSTGECAVVVSRDAATATDIVQRLAERALPISCTNHQLTVITDEPLTGAAHVTATTGAFSTATRSGTVADELRRVHPSVVLIPDDQPIIDDSSFLGYQAVHCDALGVASSTVGFGSDPVAGWPGDHRV